jgi:hypothetical protein
MIIISLLYLSSFWYFTAMNKKLISVAIIAVLGFSLLVSLNIPAIDSFVQHKVTKKVSEPCMVLERVANRILANKTSEPPKASINIVDQFLLNRPEFPSSFEEAEKIGNFKSKRYL